MSAAVLLQANNLDRFVGGSGVGSAFIDEDDED